MPVDQLFSLWGPTSPFFWVRAVWGLFAFLVVFWVASVARRGTVRALERTPAHRNTIIFATRLVQYSIIILGALLALGILGVPFAELAALFGLATVALTLSLQDIIRSLLAGLYLLVEHPFQVGDSIDVGGSQGVIEDVGMRTTVLRNPQGDRVIVPNLVLFTSIITQKNNTKVGDAP